MLKNLIYVLTLKKIPVLHWTSKYEYNLKPKLITVFYLIFGLILFGIGETLLITARYRCESLVCFTSRIVFC